MRSKFFLWVFFFFTIIGMGSSGKIAWAVNTGTIGVLPAYPDPNVNFSSSWFIYKLNLGESKEDAVRIINNSEETVIIKVYPVDATVTSDGSFALLPEDAEKKDVGGWVKLALGEVEVPPKSEKLVPFTISIPENADAGDHAGGIVIQETEGSGGQKLSGTGVKIVTRVGVRIYQTVPGEVKKDFLIKRFDWRMEPKEKSNSFLKFLDLDKKTMFIFGIENKGNVSLNPKVKVEVFNIFGRKVGEVPESEVGVVFPRTETKDAFLFWDKMPFFGRYRAQLSVGFSQEGVGRGVKDIVFWVFPYRLLVILGLIFVSFLLLRLVFQYIREVKKENMPIYEAKSGETLGSLASKFSLEWKKLAKFNEIEKPFEISSGQKLFIPVNKKNFDYLRDLLKNKEIDLPLKKQTASKRKSKARMAAIIFLVVSVGAAYIWGNNYYKRKKEKDRADQMFQSQNAGSSEEEKESNEKTKKGVVKKSSIKVRIFTGQGIDSGSSVRLREKLALIGYQAEISEENLSKKYEKTVIEYSPGNEEKAKLVKTDIGSKEELEILENTGLDVDIAVYNRLDKNNFLDLGSENSGASPSRELIKVKIFKGGANEEKIKSMREFVFQGGFDIQEEYGQIDSGKISQMTIFYFKDQEEKNALILRDFLVEKGNVVVVKKEALENYPNAGEGTLVLAVAE